MGILAGINADVWCSVSPSVTTSPSESFTDTGDHIHYLWTSHFAWDKSQPITVQNSNVNGQVNTTATAAIFPGTGIVVTPVGGTLMSFIAVGSVLTIAAGSPTAWVPRPFSGTFNYNAQELVTVTAVTGTTFTANFTREHAAGVAITTGWVTVSDYTFQYSIGQITFNTARTVGVNNYTQVIGNYFSVTQLDNCSKWNINIQAGLIKTTPFQATGSWEVNTGTVKSWTGSVEAYRTDDRLIQEITRGNLVVLQLFFNKGSNQRWQGYAFITDVVASTDSMGVLTQKISFTTINDMFYMLS